MTPGVWLRRILLRRGRTHRVTTITRTVTREKGEPEESREVTEEVVLPVESHTRDEGRSAVWLVFEVLSAVFVVTGLLVAIYSDSQLLRAIAGIALIVLVSAVTAAAIRDR